MATIIIFALIVLGVIFGLSRMRKRRLAAAARPLRWKKK